MPNVAIRETTVTPDESGSIVQLVVADVPPPYESAKIHLQLLVKLPAYELSLLAQLQLEAMTVVAEELRKQTQALATEIRQHPEFDVPNVRPIKKQS
jgi:hypothetical protein